MTDQPGFTSALQQAARETAIGAIVILNIAPDRLETGIGCIHVEGAGAVRAIRGFVEDPELSTAQAYLAEGGTFWDVGMFVPKAAVCHLGIYPSAIVRRLQEVACAKLVARAISEPIKT